MRNRYRGEASVPGVGPLRFDWDRIARLQDAFGKDFDAKISKAFVEVDLAAIATAVAIGNGCTPEHVREASPPITPTMNAVTVALNLAYHGKQEGAPLDAGENPPSGRRSILSRVLSTLRLRRD